MDALSDAQLTVSVLGIDSKIAKIAPLYHEKSSYYTTNGLFKSSKWECKSAYH